MLKDRQALILAEQLRSQDPVAADLIKAEYLFMTGDPSGAAPPVERSLFALRENPWVSQPTVSNGLSLAAILANGDRSLVKRYQFLVAHPFAGGYMDLARQEAVLALDEL
jgi:hypothetical protein